MAAPKRDYYADLELPRNSDVAEIKKQFRKLALKYHPDRNPGREDEVNAKFQVIQAANEVLSDPQEKSKYDALLARSGGRPGASGVKGNPWANVSQQFPTPPRRTAGRTATSGAQRWQSRFSSGVPPTAKQAYSSDPEAKKNAAKAFENMRKSSQRETRSSQPPPPPPRAPPRTESARQRAEASFGARKSGYYPRSAMGDEPQVSSQNYYSRPPGDASAAPKPPPRKPVPVQTGMPDPLRQFRDKPPGSAASDDKHRSSSVPRRGQQGNEPNLEVPSDGDGRPVSADEGSGVHARTSFKSRASGRSGASSDSDQRKEGANVGTDAANDEQDGPRKPTMYGKPNSTLPQSQANYIRHQSILAFTPFRLTENSKPLDSSSNVYDHEAPSGTLSNDSDTAASFLFEQQQTQLINNLIKNKKTRDSDKSFLQKSSEDCFENCGKIEYADTSFYHSFTFPLEADTFEAGSASPDRQSFSKSSVEDINTSFANDVGSNNWQFSAGSGEAEANVGRRSFANGRINRRKPTKRPTTLRADNANDASLAPQAETEFNAEGWSDKFSTQTFVPPPAPGPSVSPGRASRTNSKKSKARPTTGNAAVVIDISSDEESYKWQGRNPQSGSLGGAQGGPQAMDIDSPLSMTPPAGSSSNAAHNAPAQPSSSDWRAGGDTATTLGDDGKPARPAKIPLSSNTGGSEDSEEFRASFADLKNVEPLSPQRDGLNSFAGLKDNLPFESKASDVPPVRPPKTDPLEFPAAPEAPRPPSTVALDGMKPDIVSWEKYVQEFESYMRQWDSFNGQVVQHFATRQALIDNVRHAKGYGFLAARGDADLQEYYNAVHLDNDVRRRWAGACDEHENRLREFIAFRNKMK